MGKITTEDIMFLDKANEFIKESQNSVPVVTDENLMKEMREAIQEERFEEYKSEFYRKRKS